MQHPIRSIRSTERRSTYAGTIKRLRRSGIGVLTRTAPDRENSREGANWPTCTGINITQLAQAGKPSLGKLMGVFFQSPKRTPTNLTRPARLSRAPLHICASIHAQQQRRCGFRLLAPCQNRTYKHDLQTTASHLWGFRRVPASFGTLLQLN